MKILGKKYLIFIASLVLHVAAIGVIIYLAWPIASWYLDKIPARGIDLYNSATYVSYLTRHFATFFNGWKYIWYEGSPFGADYPFLHFYLMVPFAKYFGLLYGIQIFSLVSSFLFVALSYLTFLELSKNRILAVLLALAVAFSLNLYRSLVWAGGIPYYATQMFLPLTLFLAVKYLKTKNRSWFFALILAVGLGMLGHPQPFITTVFPTLFLLILFWAGRDEKFFQWKKIKDLIILGGMSLLIALPTIHDLIFVGIGTLFAYLRGIFGLVPLGEGIGGPGSLAKSQASYGAGSALEEASPAIVDWAHQQFLLVFQDTHLLLWLFLGASFTIFILSLPIAKNRLKKLLSLLPFVLGSGYAIFYVYLLSIGINLYHGGWYKVFWPVPLMVGFLASYLWGVSAVSLADLAVFASRMGRFLRLAILVVINLGLILGSWYTFSRYATFGEFVTKINQVSLPSSAFPESLSVKRDKGNEELKQDLLPSFLDPSQKDFRLYIIDATVNIWWNALFDLPLARGYIDPPHYGEASALFWLNSALGPSPKGGGSSLLVDWKVPEEIAENNTLFLLDWFAIKYLEGNHMSQTNSALAPYPTSEEVIKKEEIVEVPGVVRHYVEAWGGEEWLPDLKTPLKFYEIKDELVSPILSATNAPAVAVIGDESAYGTISRLLAILNLNSQKVVLVRGPKFIDDWRLTDFLNFDAIILYGYDYHRRDKAWETVAKYLKIGGKVFIDTGGEVKESDSVNLPSGFSKELPSIFPVRRTVREDLGRDWDIEVGLDSGEEINFEEFAPLDHDGKAWNISHPPSLEDLDEKATVILKNKGQPVIAAKKEGEGDVIWSGLNFPYHALRNQNWQEAKLFKILLARLVNLDPSPVSSKITWVSSEVRKVEGESAKGALFKEQYFPGWGASFKSQKGSGSLNIYSAGPSLPGFMYVRIPDKERFEVTFRFKGEPKMRLFAGISFITILFLLDYIFLRQRIIGASLKYIWNWARKRVGKWWEKEEAD